MERRSFLTSLVGLAGATLDPERLLWVPGKKLISIPKPRVLTATIAEYSDYISLTTYKKESLERLKGMFVFDDFHQADFYATLPPRTGKTVNWYRYEIPTVTAK